MKRIVRLLSITTTYPAAESIEACHESIRSVTMAYFAPNILSAPIKGYYVQPELVIPRANICNQTIDENEVSASDIQKSCLTLCIEKK